MNYVINKYFAKIEDDGIYLCQGSLQDYTRKRIITDTNKKLGSNNFTKKTMEISWWFVIHYG